MALLPFFHNNDLFANHSAGSLLGWSEPDLNHWPLMLPSRSTEHLRDLRSQLAHLDRDTSVILDKNHFQADIDVQQFKPEEITVKLSGEHTITVEGRHEDQQDDHGFISRYLLPQDCDVSKVQSKLSSDGVLTISAPKKQEGIELDGEEIPIIHTGRPIIRRMHLWPSRRSDRKRRLSASK